MRILHITFMYPTTEKPLNGVAVESIVNSLHEQNSSIEQLVLHLSGNLEEDLIGLKTPSCQYYRIKLPEFYKWFHFYNSRKAETIVSDFKPDIIHFHNIFPGIFILANYLRKTNTPYILTFRGSCAKALRFIYRRKKLKELISGASAYTFLSAYFHGQISKTLSEYHIPIDTRKVHFIPNFKKEMWSENTSKSILSSTFRLLLIANIEERKNLKNTIEAVKIARMKYPIQLDIYGEIYDQKLLNELKTDFDENILFHSTVSNDNLVEIIDNCDALILLAHLETFGIAYIESILRHRPIIYSANAGITTFIKNNSYGIAVKDENNLNEISNAIQTCIETYSGFEFSETEKFLASTVIPCWTRIYRDAISNK